MGVSQIVDLKSLNSWFNAKICCVPGSVGDIPFLKPHHMVNVKELQGWKFRVAKIYYIQICAQAQKHTNSSSFLL